MPSELRWTSRPEATIWHALDCLAQGHPLVDDRVSRALVPLVDRWRSLTQSAGDADRLVGHLVPLALAVDDPVALAAQVLAKARGPGRPPRLDDDLAQLAAEARSLSAELWPDLLSELQLRAGPLSEQWESRGPGLLRQIALQTDEALIAPQAEIMLVLPVCGGGGAPHPWYNAVRFEALLTNPSLLLPEVVRLAWLLSQLQFDLPAFESPLPLARRRRVSSLAMVPIALDAAQQVELAGCDRRTLTEAVRLWNLTVDQPVTLAESLERWWTVYQEQRPNWTTALVALDGMLNEGVSGSSSGTGDG